MALAALLVLAFASPARADIAIGGPPPETFSGAALFNATSQDGRRVVYSSRRRLVRDDRDRVLDVYLRKGGKTTLLSPGPTAGEPVRFVAATPDARTVLLRTEGRLTADDRDSSPDLYRQGPAGLDLISIGPAAEKASGDELRFGVLAANGRRVFFVSEEQLLGEDDDDRRDVYEHRGGRLRLVTAGTADSVKLHAVATDGSRLVVSTSTGFDPRDVDGFRDIYSYGPGGTTLISAGGLPSCPMFAPERRQCVIEFVAASSDAGRVYFETEDRLSPLDSDSSTDVYRGGERGSELISTGPGDAGSSSASLSAITPDGRRAFFIGGPFKPLAGDIYCAVYERRGGHTELVSEVRGKPSPVSGCETEDIAVSKDGSAVVFPSGGSDDQSGHLYRRERGKTVLVSAPRRPSSAQLGAFLKHVSADGSRVAFLTWRALVPADKDGGYDIYSAGPRGFTLVSLGPAGGNAPHAGPPGSLIGDVFPQFGGASDDGRRVFFTTEESLIRRDRNEDDDLYERGPAGLRLVSTR